jgi:hypothetical protein
MAGTIHRLRFYFRILGFFSPQYNLSSSWRRWRCSIKVFFSYYYVVFRLSVFVLFHSFIFASRSNVLADDDDDDDEWFVQNMRFLFWHSFVSSHCSTTGCNESKRDANEELTTLFPMFFILAVSISSLSHRNCRCRCSMLSMLMIHSCEFEPQPLFTKLIFHNSVMNFIKNNSQSFAILPA